MPRSGLGNRGQRFCLLVVAAAVVVGGGVGEGGVDMVETGAADDATS